MAKFSKFDETKINLIMTVRGASREEAISALRREHKGTGRSCKGRSAKDAVSAAEFFRHCEPEMVSAEEFFRED